MLGEILARLKEKKAPDKGTPRPPEVQR